MMKNDRYSDEQVIEKILKGETALYEIIIRRYNPYLFKTGRSYGFDHADTEDLMQETYLNAYKHLKSFENRSSFKTWLVKIMLNQCYQKKRKNQLQSAAVIPLMQENLEPMLRADHSDTDKTILSKELKNVVENALHQIPEDYRMVFSLRELSGLNTTETSDALNISESNVKVRLNRAKTMLRSEIEKMYSPDEIFEFNLIYCDRMVESVMSQLGNIG